MKIFGSSRSLAAVLSNGKAYGWGDNNGSRIKCTSNQNDVSTQVQITSFTNVKEIDYGTFHSVILTDDGKVYTCGRVYANSNVGGNAHSYRQSAVVMPQQMVRF